MIIRATSELDGNDYVEIKFNEDADINDMAVELRKLLYGMGYTHSCILEILPEE